MTSDSGDKGLGLLIGRRGAIPDRIAARARAAEQAIGRLADALSAALGTEVSPIRAEASRKATPPSEGAVRWPAEGEAKLLYELLPGHALKLTEAAFRSPVGDESLAAAVVGRALRSSFVALAEESAETVTEGAPLLACTYCLELGGEPVTLTVHLPTGKGPRLGQTPAFRRVAVAVEAKIGRVDLPIGLLAALRPGDRIDLPGGSLDAITLCPAGKTGILATGELGKDAARRAIKLSEIAA